MAGAHHDWQAQRVQSWLDEGYHNEWALATPIKAWEYRWGGFSNEATNAWQHCKMSPPSHVSEMPVGTPRMPQYKTFRP